MSYENDAADAQAAAEAAGQAAQDAAEAQEPQWQTDAPAAADGGDNDATYTYPSGDWASGGWSGDFGDGGDGGE